MYFYIRLHAGKQKKFFQLLERKDGLNLSDYADILASGPGAIPEREVVERMEREYGFATPAEVLAP